MLGMMDIKNDVRLADKNSHNISILVAAYGLPGNLSLKLHYTI